ncbi:hypothetical protein SAMN02927895_00558 [Belnapia rosea]|nr:hypothetical protein SAMN02927895_00558 [Belnapia rosea]
MPELTGAVLADQIAQRYPGLPVAPLTGNAGIPPLEPASGVPVSRKPLGPAELAARLRELAATMP